MTSYTFAVDIDGVIRDWDAGLKHVWRELGGEADDVCTSWELRNHYRHPHGLDVYDVAFRDHPGLLQRKAPAIPGALLALNHLAKSGVRLFFVSAQPNHACRVATTRWLVDHAVPLDGIVYVAGKGDKNVVEADLFLDDGPHNLERFAEGGKRFIVMDRPYNQQAPHGLGRFSDWTAIERFVLTDYNSRLVAA